MKLITAGLALLATASAVVMPEPGFDAPALLNHHDKTPAVVRNGRHNDAFHVLKEIYDQAEDRAQHVFGSGVVRETVQEGAQHVQDVADYEHQLEEEFKHWIYELTGGHDRDQDEGRKHGDKKHGAKKHKGEKHDDKEREDKEHEGRKHGSPRRHGKGQPEEHRDDDEHRPKHPPGKGPGHKKPHKKPGHKKPHPPHKKPHHGHNPHRKFENDTLLHVVKHSPYHSKFWSCIEDDNDIVDLLNTTKANVTIFAPNNRAFEKAEKHHSVTKEFVRDVFYYHLLPGFYPAGRVLGSKTLPTAFEEEDLGDENHQRIRVSLGLGGLRLNFYAKIKYVDVFAKNGVLHSIDAILVPPPRLLTTLETVPGEYSTFVGALYKTGYADLVNSSESHGLTVFAPSNRAFQRLGFRVNRFLFSDRGRPFLKKLIEYHIAPNSTLYTDALLEQDRLIEEVIAAASNDETKPEGGPKDHRGHFPPPPKHYHVDLPTLLSNHSLSIDIFKFGPVIDFKINGQSKLVVPDVLGKNGVVQTLGFPIIPPRKVPGGGHGADAEFANEEQTQDEDMEMDVEEFKALFE